MRNMEVGERRGSAAAVADLALTACCRRKALLAYFGEKRGRCESPEELCDFCTDSKAVVWFCHTEHSFTWADMLEVARLIWMSFLLSWLENLPN